MTQPQPTQPVTWTPTGTGSGAIRKWFGDLFRSHGPTLVLLYLVGYCFIWKCLVTPSAQAVGNKMFEFSNKNSFVLSPNEWRSVPTHAGEGLDIKAANPAHSKFLFAMIRRPGVEPKLVTLDEFMATDIDVGRNHSYVEVGMGKSKDAPDSVQVLVTYCR